MADDTLRCGISAFRTDECGCYYLFPHEHDAIKIKCCFKDVTSHLKSVGVATGGSYRHFSLGEPMKEGQLILYRVGLFDDRLYRDVTVCPHHRYKLGIYFKQNKTCSHPSHSGNGKAYRGITVQESRDVLQSFGVLLPVGTGLCRSCSKKVAPSTIEDTKDLDTTEEEKTETSSCLSIMNIDGESSAKTDTQPSSADTDFLTFSQDDDDSIAKTETQPSTAETDSMTFSQDLSQTSSWSTDEKKGDILLDDVNTALSLLSNGKMSPLKYQVRTDIASLHPSSKRMLKRKATTAIEALMDCLAPGQASELTELIKMEKQHSPVPDLTNTIVKLYENTNDCHMKKQMLSMLAKDYTKKQLQEMIPGLTVYGIDQARLHASVHGEGSQVPKQIKQNRQRLPQWKVAHALDFFFNPLFHQVSSYGTKEMKLNTGEKILIPEVVRTVCHANLVHMYQAFCKEADVDPLSRSSLFEILRVCPASKRTSLRGLDNIATDGSTAFDTLDEVKKQLKLYLTDPEVHNDLEKTEQDLHLFKLYIKTDFKLHTSLADQCPDHCIMFALSDPKDQTLQNKCTHSHNMVCDRCELFSRSIINLKRVTSEEKDIPVELKSELLQDIEVGESNILSWKQHLVRCANQDRCRQALLGSLKKEEVFIIMDWAMKFLPLSFREKQSDWYAQKGINWHVCVCIFKDDESNLKHRTYTHIFDQVKQDWFAVVSVLEHTLRTVMKQLPCITTAYLRSDNAGCYHCGNTLLSLDGISERTGITIKRYDFSEAQDGKSYCDAKIAHLRCKIRQYVSSGNNVKTAGDMKNAIDSLGGVMGCQSAHVQINSQVAGEANKIKNTWKGISKISNIELREKQIIAFKAFGVGCGNVMPEEQLKKICPSPLSATEIVVISDFVVPKKEAGSITFKAHDLVTDTIAVELPVDSNHNETMQPLSNSIFTCIEPCCSRVFQTYSGLESHILLGNHQIKLNRISTYDNIKIKWKESCLNIAEHATVSRDSKLTPGSPSSDMGWAIKKDRKNQRFTENVKTYLRAIFNAGEQSGRKSNADDVSRNMRVCRDENGNKMFQPDECLQPSQIASFFSRLCVMTRNTRPQQTLDDEDLEPALNLIDAMEAMDVLNS